MQIPALQPQLPIKLTGIPAEDIARNTQVADQEKVHELCRQFEAVLLRQILNDAQKTVIQSSLTPKSSAHDLYQDMSVNQLADSISRSGSFGFARSLEQELTRQVLHHKSIPKESSEN
jgi:Rod binding domain-containing protein